MVIVKTAARNPYLMLKSVDLFDTVTIELDDGTKIVIEADSPAGEDGILKQPVITVP